MDLFREDVVEPDDVDVYGGDILFVGIVGSAEEPTVPLGALHVTKPSAARAITESGFDHFDTRISFPQGLGKMRKRFEGVVPSSRSESDHDTKEVTFERAYVDTIG
jgi:hypothetical protein